MAKVDLLRREFGPRRIFMPWTEPLIFMLREEAQVYAFPTTPCRVDCAPNASGLTCAVAHDPLDGVLRGGWKRSSHASISSSLVKK